MASAYGLTITGVDDVAGLNPSHRGRPGRIVNIRRLPLGEDEPSPRFDDDRVVHHLHRGGYVDVRRTAATATFRTSPVLSDGELVHPGLAAVGASFAYWYGREVFHGGAFIRDGSAWGVLGSRRAGKSTLLTALAQRGRRIVADDLLVVGMEDDTPMVHAGPRCLDLRQDSAAALGVTTLPSPRPDRVRLPLAPAPLEVPLAGWILVQSSHDLLIETVPPPQRLRKLAAHRTILTRPSPQPEQLLALVDRPVLELHRPQSWTTLDETVDVVLQRVEDPSARTLTRTSSA